MTPQTIPETYLNKDWPRKVAQAVNRLLRGPQGFERLNTAPTEPFEGQSYYDMVLHISRTWDGTVWQNHW